MTLIELKYPDLLPHYFARNIVQSFFWFTLKRWLLWPHQCRSKISDSLQWSKKHSIKNLIKTSCFKKRNLTRKKFENNQSNLILKEGRKSVCIRSSKSSFLGWNWTFSNERLSLLQSEIEFGEFKNWKSKVFRNNWNKNRLCSL